MISQKPFYNQGLSPRLQIVVFIALTIGMLTLGNMLALGYIFLHFGTQGLMDFISLDLTSPTVVQNLWVLQIVGTTLPILSIPIVFGKFIMRQPDDYLKLNNRFPSVLMLIVLVIMAADVPFMETLITFNRKMVLPEFLKGLEEAMQRAEKNAQRVTGVLLKMNSWWDMIKALLLVGLATAIAEELMFRGVLQTIFIRWTKNIHVSIWVTAALFSAFHMEFYGFLPRMALGVLFGYFTVWSGSIWPAVWAHFLNNGTAVVLTFLYQQKRISTDPNSEQVFNYFLPVLSVIFTVALLQGYRKVASRKTIADSV